jgi:hypothetical protein
VFYYLVAFLAQLFQSFIHIAFEKLKTLRHLFLVLLITLHELQTRDVRDWRVKDVINVKPFEVRVSFELLEREFLGRT